MALKWENGEIGKGGNMATTIEAQDQSLKETEERRKFRKAKRQLELMQTKISC